MKNTMQPESAAVQNAENCQIVHGKSPDGKLHIVWISALKVVITKDGQNWFAQGLDVDYAAEGTSVDEAKANFENGLVGTIHQHLKAYSDPSSVFKPAPPEVWQEMFYEPIMGTANAPSSMHGKYYQTSVHFTLRELSIEFPNFAREV